MPKPNLVEGFTTSHALLIAIDAYINGVPVLRTPVTDARELKLTLERDHGFQVNLLVNEQATLAGIRASLEELRQRTTDSDRVLFYFAGHGIAQESDLGPTGYILPQDSERGSVQGYLPMVDLERALSELPCRHVFVILDCCFAGAFRWSSTRHLSLAPANLHRERYTWFIQDAAWQVLASAAHDQKALDVAAESPLGKRDDAAQHSPFAKALLAGLAGAADLRRADGTGDGVITATELYLYIDEELRPPPGSSRGYQTPIFWPLRKHDKGQFVFLVPGGTLSLPAAPVLDSSANPWRALEPYEFAHRDLFYGRLDSIEALLAHFYGRAQGASENATPPRFVVVTGASGVGKTSLVRAGLLPRLQQDFGARFLTIIARPSRPGPDIFASLGDALKTGAPEQLPPPDARQIATDRASLTRWCRQITAERDLLLVVDQAEELLTTSAAPTDVEQFLALIVNLLNDQAHTARVLMTVRSEFEPQFAQSALKDRWPTARFLVRNMTPNELRRVIEGPAAGKVLRFESDELVDTLVNEVISMPGGLPILSFSLSQMYLNYLARRGTDRVITRLDYAQLQGGPAPAEQRDLLKGGVTAALRVRADEVLDALDAQHADNMRRMLERMVSVESGQFTRRRVPRSELAFEGPANASNPSSDGGTVEMLGRLDAARLIVTDELAGEPHVELAHDALILGWARLLGWVRQDARRIDTLRRLTLDAKQWSADRDKVDLLWSDAARCEMATDLLTAPFPGLNRCEAEFARASERRSGRNRRMRTVITTAIACLAIVAIVITALNAIGTRRDQIDRLLSTARSYHGAGDTPRAYAFSQAALDKASRWRFLWGDRPTAAATLAAESINEGVPLDYEPFETTFGVALSDDGGTLASIGRTKSQDNRHDTLLLGEPNAPARRLEAGEFVVGAFRPHTRELYTVKYNNSQLAVAVRDSASGLETKNIPIPGFAIPQDSVKGLSRRTDRPLIPHVVDDIQFTSDGKYLVLAGWASIDKEGVLKQPWRAYYAVDSGTFQHFVSPDEQVDMQYDAYVQRVRQTDDGSRGVAAGLYDIYLDEAPLGHRTTIGRRQAGVVDVAISPSGKQVVACGDRSDAGTNDNMLTVLRNNSSGSWSQFELRLPGTEAAEKVEFIAENTLAVSRSDYSISVVSIKDPVPAANERPILDQDPTDDAPPIAAQPPFGALHTIAAQPIFGLQPANTTAGPVQLQAEVHQLRGHTARIHSLLIDRAHNRIISGGEDRVIRIWGVSNGSRRALRGSARAIQGLRLSPSGDWLLSWDLSGEILAWHLTEGLTPVFSNEFPRKVFEEPISTDDYNGAGDGGTLTAYVNRMDAHFVDRVAVASTDQYVAIAYYGGPTVILDQQDHPTQTLNEDEGFTGISADGRYLLFDKAVATADDHFAHTTKLPIAPLVLRNQWVSIESGTPAFHPFGASGADLSHEKVTELGEDEVRFFSPDSHWLISLDGRRYCFWQASFMSTGSCGRVPSPWSFMGRELAFSPDSSWFVTLATSEGQNHLIRVNLADGHVNVFGSGELGIAFALSKDGKQVAAGGRFGEIYLGSTDGSSLQEIGRHTRSVLALAFNAAGDRLASGSLDRTARVWSTRTYDSASYEFLNPVESVVFEDNAHRLLVASGGSVTAISELSEADLLDGGHQYANYAVNAGSANTVSLLPITERRYP